MRPLTLSTAIPALGLIPGDRIASSAGAFRLARILEDVALEQLENVGVLEELRPARWRVVRGSPEEDLRAGDELHLSRRGNLRLRRPLPHDPTAAALAALTTPTETNAMKTAPIDLLELASISDHPQVKAFDAGGAHLATKREELDAETSATRRALEESLRRDEDALARGELPDGETERLQARLRELSQTARVVAGALAKRQKTRQELVGQVAGEWEREVVLPQLAGLARRKRVVLDELLALEAEVQDVLARRAAVIPAAMNRPGSGVALRELRSALERHRDWLTAFIEEAAR